MPSTPKSEIKILHITDLHIGKKNKDDGSINANFHHMLLNYLVSEFNQKVDYLIVSGDFGDKCECIEESIVWLKDLASGISVDANNIILCAGNHDLLTSELEDHHQDQRLRFELGLEYILKNLNGKESNSKSRQ